MVKVVVVADAVVAVATVMERTVADEDSDYSLGSVEDCCS